MWVHMCALRHTQKFPIIFQVCRKILNLGFIRFLLVFTTWVNRSEIWLDPSIREPQHARVTRHTSLRIQQSMKRIFLFLTCLRLPVDKHCLETKFNKYCIISLLDAPKRVGHFPPVWYHSHSIWHGEAVALSMSWWVGIHLKPVSIN